MTPERPVPVVHGRVVDRRVTVLGGRVAVAGGPVAAVHGRRGHDAGCGGWFRWTGGQRTSSRPCKDLARARGVWFVVLVVVLMVGEAPGAFGTDAVRASQKAALVDFYESTGGSQWKSAIGWSEWPVISEYCGWQGVSCSGDYVASISLPNNNLVGTLPASLNTLVQLGQLHVPSNLLTGAFPDLRNCTQLELLYIQDNNFTTVANALRHPTLNTLEGANNSMTDDISLFAHKTSQIVVLDLSFNRLHGSLSQALLDSFPHISILTLAHNNLDSTLEVDFSRSGIVSLDLSYNRIFGAFPTSLASMHFIQNIDLSFNSISGSVPDRWPSTLRSLYVQGNRLSGSVPDSLACNSSAAIACNFGGNPDVGCPSACPTTNKCNALACGSCVNPVTCTGNAMCAGLGGACGLCVGGRCRATPPPPPPPPPPSPIAPTHINPDSRRNEVIVLVVLLALCGGLIAATVVVRSRRQRTAGSLAGSQSLLAAPNTLMRRYGDDGHGSFGSSFADTLDQSLHIPFAQISLGEPLGQGSYGSVYHGQVDGQDYAIKEMRLSPKIAQSAIQEITVMAHLDHPNLVRFVGYSFNDHSAFLVLELVEGGSLSEVLDIAFNADIRLHMRDKIRMALDIARGLRFMHDNGVLHRDLKSANVLVAVDATDTIVAAKLADFGVSKVRDDSGSLFTTQTIRGTPVYMAPEMLQSFYGGADRAQYSKSADIFSLGILLFEMFTESLLFRERKWSAAMAVRGQRPPFPDGFREAYPDVTALIQRCWQADPARRPAIAHIEAALQGWHDSGELNDGVYFPPRASPASPN